MTLAPGDAIACTGGEIMTPAAEPVGRTVDSTGAGDLLVAAYIWAELRGADPADQLRWAVLYASLAVTTPTGVGGAVKEAELIEAGLARGLTAPPAARSQHRCGQTLEEDRAAVTTARGRARSAASKTCSRPGRTPKRTRLADFGADVALRLDDEARTLADVTPMNVSRPSAST